jgi:hypothetical protein
VRQLAPDVGWVHPRSVLELEGRIVGVLDLYPARPLIGDRLVAGHDNSFPPTGATSRPLFTT